MRPCVFFLTLLAVITVVLADEPRPFDHDLEDAEVEKLPAGWIADKTGNGPGGNWKVLEDESAPRGPKVLAQTIAGPKFLCNLCLIDDAIFLNGKISVAFKAVSGENEQGGGIVWRYIDSNNYYLARVSPLEDNLRIYKVVAGRRIPLATKEGLHVSVGEWHTLSVHHIGANIICLLDGEQLLETTDATYKKPGRVGLWTKADALTYFDGLSSAPSE